MKHERGTWAYLYARLVVRFRCSLLLVKQARAERSSRAHRAVDQQARLEGIGQRCSEPIREGVARSWSGGDCCCAEKSDLVKGKQQKGRNRLSRHTAHSLADLAELAPFDASLLHPSMPSLALVVSVLICHSVPLRPGACRSALRLGACSAASETADRSWPHLPPRQ